MASPMFVSGTTSIDIMQGNCLVTTNMRIEDVIAQAPRGKKAMFRIVSAPSSVDDRFLGEHVYVKDGKVYDFMADKHVAGLKAEDLMFINYV